MRGGEGAMTFSKDSGLVKVWVSLVMAGTYTLDQVPQLYNLKTVVSEVVNATA
ncbi:CD1375 family protein [Paenibacillus lactis]|uniref:CD1375 family protein n=1 Tax=Paenibacillus lactis TaxID=228574 RepID=UPI0027962D65|nr:CD1375 family protein [Paenibacillus lactis]